MTRRTAALLPRMLLALTLLAAAVPPALARAGDEPFTGPNNFGVTGLFETPTARVMTENRYRLGATQVRPYRYYFGTVGLFDRIEVNGRVTGIIGVPGFDNNTSYGNYKDKAVDAKFQFLKEGKYLPALAFVVSDPTGTRLYASQSIVASKQIFPFDFSLGFGNGRLGKRPLPPHLEGFDIELFTNPAQVGARGPPVRRHPVRRDALALAARGVQPDPLRTPDDRSCAEEIFPDRRPLPVQFRRTRQAAQVAGNRRELAAGERNRRRRLRRLRHRPAAGSDLRPAVPGVARGDPRAAARPDRPGPVRSRLQRHRRLERRFHVADRRAERPVLLRAPRRGGAPFDDRPVHPARRGVRPRAVERERHPRGGSGRTGLGPFHARAEAGSRRSADAKRPGSAPRASTRRSVRSRTAGGSITASSRPSRRFSTTRPASSSTASAWSGRSARSPGEAGPRSSNSTRTRSTTSPRRTPRFRFRSAATWPTTCGRTFPSGGYSSPRRSPRGNRRTCAWRRGCSS